MMTARKDEHQHIGGGVEGHADANLKLRCIVTDELH